MDQASQEKIQKSLENYQKTFETLNKTVKDKEKELSDVKSNMDKTAKEKRDSDAQVDSLQKKIQELEELVNITKDNIKGDANKNQSTSVTRQIEEKDNEIAEMREQIKLMN